MAKEKISYFGCRFVAEVLAISGPETPAHLPAFKEQYTTGRVKIRDQVSTDLCSLLSGPVIH